MLTSELMEKRLSQNCVSLSLSKARQAQYDNQTDLRQPLSRQLSVINS